LTEHLGGEVYTLQGEDKAQSGWERAWLCRDGREPAERLSQVAFKHPLLLLIIPG